MHAVCLKRDGALLTTLQTHGAGQFNVGLRVAMLLHGCDKRNWNLAFGVNQELPVERVVPEDCRQDGKESKDETGTQ